MDGFLRVALAPDAVVEGGPFTVTECVEDVRAPTLVCVATNIVVRSSAAQMAPINTRATARGRLGHTVRLATMTAQLSAPFRMMPTRVGAGARAGGRQ